MNSNGTTPHPTSTQSRPQRFRGGLLSQRANHSGIAMTRTVPLAIITACGLVLAANANAQSWTHQAPSPTDRDLYSAAFTSPEHGFIISLNHGLFETFDGGDTWTERSLTGYGSDPYYDIHFFDDLHGWITGNNTDQLYTTDGGASWQTMDSFAGSWSHIDFITPTIGFFGANGALAKTNDGGQNWQLRSGYPDCPVIYGMDFRDESVGLVAGYHIGQRTRGVFRTNDGGQTWFRTLAVSSNDVVFTDANTAIAAAVADRRMYKSSDGGLTWIAWSGVFEEDGPLGDITYVGGTTLAGCSFDGDVWMSTDLGLNWTKTLDAIGDLPYGWWELNFVDMDHGWFNGPHGILYRTTDGGMTWEYLTHGIGMDIEHIEMLTDSFGMALADNGYLLRTTNAGRDWSVQKLEVTGQIFARDENLYALDIVDQNFAAAAGPGGTVFKTLDGGLTWLSIGYPNLPGDFWIEDVEFIDHNVGYLVGSDHSWSSDKGVYMTTNGGLTWTRPFDDSALAHVDAVDRQHVWIMHIAGRLHATRNGGQTWSDTYLPDVYFGDDATIMDMEFLDADTGWVCGWWDYVARTSDGGDTWQTFTFGNNHDIRVALGLAVVSADEVWVTAATGTLAPVLLHTTNGGQSWTRTYLNQYQYAFGDIDASPNGSIWAGGFRGNIISSVVAVLGDMNCDDVLNGADIDPFFLALGDPGAYAARFPNCDPQNGDINGDGRLDGGDIDPFFQCLGGNCP